MHGVKRSKLTAQQAEAKEAKEAAKIQSYKAAQDAVLARRKARDYSEEALGSTTMLLDLNPEYYTIWNYRRIILLEGIFPRIPASERVIFLGNDLKLTTSYLKIHPKVYWIWNHRKWCLENVPLGPTEGQSETEGWRNEFWAKELKLVELMLNVDARNFHAWDYRRYILASLPASFKPPRTPEDELRYTTKKIEANFSNFSAWHQRTKILAGLWESLDAETVKAEKAKEFDLVTQALWTDPADQSGWLYHRWLIGDASDVDTVSKEVQNIKELLEAEPDAKWPLVALTQYVLALAKRDDTPADASRAMREDVRRWLKDLERIDGDRRERYREIAHDL